MRGGNILGNFVLGHHSDSWTIWMFSRPRLAGHFVFVRRTCSSHAAFCCIWCTAPVFNLGDMSPPGDILTFPRGHEVGYGVQKST